MPCVQRSTEPKPPQRLIQSTSGRQNSPRRRFLKRKPLRSRGKKCEPHFGFSLRNSYNRSHNKNPSIWAFNIESKSRHFNRRYLLSKLNWLKIGKNQPSQTKPAEHRIPGLAQARQCMSENIPVVSACAPSLPQGQIS